MELINKLTYGKKLVGVNFNPSGNQIVLNVKLAYAEAIDNIHDLSTANPDHPELQAICQKAIQDTITAQMWAVKALTWEN